MKTFFIIWSTILALSILTVSMGWCHGVEGYVEQIKGYCITAMYDDGEPMSYAAVEIKAPNSDIAFQTGRTDRNGCFMVKADAPGVWQAVVSDGMGHRLSLDYPIEADKGSAQGVEETAALPGSNQMGRPLKVIAGLSVIIGLCGFFYGWKARRNDSNPLASKRSVH
jgi:nickel transport protein